MIDIKDRLNKVEKKLEGTVHREIDQAIAEKNDIERRKCNLVIYNFPEPIKTTDDDTWDTDAKIAKDIENMEDFIQKELRISMVMDSEHRIVDCRRLGLKKRDSRNEELPRPLKVQFVDIKVKRDVLSRAKDLRQSQNLVAKKVFINPDLTEAQRKRDSLLRDEMWTRRTEKNENVIIRRGEIVTVTWNVPKVRKTKQNKAITTQPQQKDALNSTTKTRNDSTSSNSHVVEEPPKKI